MRNAAEQVCAPVHTRERLAGFETEAMCAQIRDGMTEKANSTVKFKCDKCSRVRVA
jgi:hypothetical protein